MITLVLQQLDELGRDLARIDPAHELDAADKVAAIAQALRRTLRDAASGEHKKPRKINALPLETAAVKHFARHHLIWVDLSSTL